MRSPSWAWILPLALASDASPEDAARPTGHRTSGYEVVQLDSRSVAISGFGRQRRLELREVIVGIEVNPGAPYAVLFAAREAPAEDLREYVSCLAKLAYVVHLPSGRNRPFVPDPEDPFVCGWPIPPWSPDGQALVFPMGHYGPFHVFRTRSLRDWIDERPVAVTKVSSLDNDPARVHTFVGWVDEDVFLFQATCCAHVLSWRFHVATGELEAEPTPPPP
jgi:hypothetical protein